MKLATLILALAPALSFADPAVIEAARASKAGETWRFDVTLRHGDTGWDNYADGWRVLSPDGEELGYRELVHPHVDEQPFTRALSGVSLPDGTLRILIQSRTNTDGWSGDLFELILQK